MLLISLKIIILWKCKKIRNSVFITFWELVCIVGHPLKLCSRHTFQIPKETVFLYPFAPTYRNVTCTVQACFRQRSSCAHKSPLAKISVIIWLCTFCQLRCSPSTFLSGLKLQTIEVRTYMTRIHMHNKNLCYLQESKFKC